MTPEEHRAIFREGWNYGIREAARVIGDLPGGERDRDEALHEAMQAALGLLESPPSQDS